MTRQDWNDYAGYLKSQINTAELSTPKSIGEAYNNYLVMQDLEDVKSSKLGIKPRDAKAKA